MKSKEAISGKTWFYVDELIKTAHRDNRTKSFIDRRFKSKKGKSFRCKVQKIHIHLEDTNSSFNPHEHTRAVKRTNTDLE